jgi:DNA-binding MarR family transcriptional regulator
MAIVPLREKHDGALDRSASVRLWLRLLSCSTIIEKRIRRGLIEDFDTTLPRFDVLAALDRHPEGMPLGALSRALLVSNGNITAIVRTLIKDGFVAVAPDPRDGRASIAVMTPAGRTHFDQVAAAHHAWVDAMMADVPPSHRDLLFDLLGAVKLSVAHADPDKTP